MGSQGPGRASRETEGWVIVMDRGVGFWPVLALAFAVVAVGVFAVVKVVETWRKRGRRHGRR